MSVDVTKGKIYIYLEAKNGYAEETVRGMKKLFRVRATAGDK